MAKKKKTRASKNRKQSKGGSARPPSERRIKLPARLARELPKAHRFLAQQRWPEAFALLNQLDRKFPGQPDVLNELVNASYELKDYTSYLQYIRRLYTVKSNPDILFRLGTAYLVNQYPFAAIHYFQEFLDRYPEHEHASIVSTQLAEVTDASNELLDDFAVGLANEAEVDKSELTFLHDMLRAASELIEIEEARQVGGELLEKYPDFVPALNNLSQIEHLAGNVDAATELTQKVLEKEPENFQAMGNLTRYLYLSGQVESAKQSAESLKKLTSENPDIWLKKAETFSYLGDEQAVLDAVTAAQAVSDIDAIPGTPHLYHLGGVAAAHLGYMDQAKSLWKAALAIAPSFSIAKENLLDLAKKPWQRNGAWSFSTQQWLQSSFVGDMDQMLASGELGKNGNRPASDSLQPYLDANPHISHLMSILLERGDDRGRTIAIELARFSEHPELTALAKEFALGQRGSDDQRLAALHAMVELNVIPGGSTKLWIKGEWTEIMTLGFEVGDESDVYHPFRNRTAMNKMERSTILMQEGRDEEALQLLEEAYELEPDNPGIVNNLAGVRSRVTGEDNTLETLERLTSEFPDYLFGHTGMANYYILEKEFDKAAKHLNPLLERKKLHYSEFRALAESFIRLSLAEGKPEGARNWLDMWQRVEPGHPGQERYELQIGLFGFGN